MRPPGQVVAPVDRVLGVTVQKGICNRVDVFSRCLLVEATLAVELSVELAARRELRTQGTGVSQLPSPQGDKPFPREGVPRG